MAGPGGKREGAGRKRGTVGQRTRDRLALADKLVAAGITPLEVMLEAMHAHHAAKRLDQAAAIAKDAAPYMHPRLASHEVTGKDGGAGVKFEVLLRWMTAEMAANRGFIDVEEETPKPILNGTPRPGTD